jgi:hypothetical protein
MQTPYILIGQPLFQHVRSGDDLSVQFGVQLRITLDFVLDIRIQPTWHQECVPEVIPALAVATEAG